MKKRKVERQEESEGVYLEQKKGNLIWRYQSLGNLLRVIKHNDLQITHEHKAARQKPMW